MAAVSHPGAVIRDVAVGGETFRVGPLTMGDWWEVQDFLNALPAPRAATPDLAGVLPGLVGPPELLATLPDEERRAHLAEARRQAGKIIDGHVAEARNLADHWPPQVLTPEGHRALFTAPGGVQLLFSLAIRKHNPGVTRERAEELFRELLPRVWDEVVTVALDLLGPGEDDDRPKDGGTAPASGSTTTPSTGKSSSAPGGRMTRSTR